MSATCDRCGSLSTFNRIDDFGDVSPISGRRVRCSACKEEFWINGDTVSTAFEFLIRNSDEHFKLKRYMPAIANLAQAWEVFFATWAASTYIYRPFFAQSMERQDIADLNALFRDLHTAIEQFSFDSLRNLGMHMIISDDRPEDILEASSPIRELGALRGKPAQASIRAVPDTRRKEMLKGLEGLTIGKLRNHVVHKQAYRPRRAEVSGCLESEVRILYRIKHRFGVGDFMEHQADAVYMDADLELT